MALPKSLLLASFERFKCCVTIFSLGSIRLATLLVLALRPQVALAEYEIARGDVLEFSVVGHSELQRRAAVNLDGNVIFPIVGQVNAAGLSLSALRSRVLPLLGPRSPIRPNDILIDLAEARPLYVSGDVMNPGAFPYRGGLTVSHAIALAGGLRRLVSDNATFLMADLNNQLAALQSQYAKGKVLLASLTAEMNGETRVGADEIRKYLPQNRADDIIELENSALNEKLLEIQRKENQLRRAIELAEERTSALEELERTEKEAVKRQVADLERVKALSQRGLTNAERVSMQERATSLQQSRYMDTTARLAGARQDAVRLRRQLEQADDRKLRIPDELRKANMDVEGIRAQINALLLAASAVASTPRDHSLKPQLTILRFSSGKPTWVTATEETVVEPGDLVKVLKRLPDESARSLSFGQQTIN